MSEQGTPPGSACPSPPWQDHAIAIVVSESNSTVWLFHNGQIILRVEPVLRAMIFREFDEPETPADTEQSVYELFREQDLAVVAQLIETREFLTH